MEREAEGTREVDENKCDTTDDRIQDGDAKGHADGTKVVDGGRGVKGVSRERLVLGGQEIAEGRRSESLF